MGQTDRRRLTSRSISQRLVTLLNVLYRRYINKFIYLTAAPVWRRHNTHRERRCLAVETVTHRAWAHAGLHVPGA